jgi:O-antigen ligase
MPSGAAQFIPDNYVRPSLLHYLILAAIAALLLLVLAVTQNVYFAFFGFAGLFVLLLSAIPTVRVLILIALLPLAHAGIGLDFLPGFGVYNIYSFLVILLFVLSVPLKFPGNISRVPVLHLSVLMLLSFIPSILMTVDLTETIKAFFNLTSNILVAYAVFIILSESKSAKVYEWASKVFIFVAVGVSIYGIYQTLTSASVFALFTGRAYFRMFGDVNYYSSYLLMAFSLTMGYVFRNTRLMKKIPYILGLFVLTTAIIATVSRSALLTLIFMILMFMGYLFVYQQGSRKFISMAVIVVFIAIIGAFLFTDIGSQVIDLFTLSQRLQTVVEGRDTSLGQRMTILNIGWEMTRSSPIVGVGFGAFEKTFNAFQGARLTTGLERSAHNTLVRIFAETGIIGLIGSMVFLSALLYKILYAIFRCKDYNSRIALYAMFGAIASFLVMCITLDMLFEPHFWVVAGMTLAYVHNEQKKPNHRESEK